MLEGMLHVFYTYKVIHLLSVLRILKPFRHGLTNLKKKTDIYSMVRHGETASADHHPSIKVMFAPIFLHITINP